MSCATAATSSARCSSAAGSAPARAGADDAGQAYGAHARFWVEPERREEFAAASGGAPRRVGVASLRDGGARGAERTVELRYESLVAIPRARRPDRGGARRGRGPLADALRRTRTPTSIGRWRDDLSRRAARRRRGGGGRLLAELGYAERRVP